ncbi:antitoxin Xre/MbcA/ParS toxin-binding domain-containing protein [Pelagibius marinus]|uniref:antitoxin Xre/MbcA/ParS toxin-binding domain-containing protein n=1 Tax=Pelagibius marinus TaxID=2762760 RepID=UPI0018726883|nr:antitoxin Xre/MbcA/ParS toxin-binding domain-containing protein [Pelagibius marinus]
MAPKGAQSIAIPNEADLTRAIELLGGPQVIDSSILEDPLALYEQVARGFPATALEHFINNCPVIAGDPALSQILGPPVAVGCPSSNRQNELLSSYSSDQLWRLAVVVARVERAYGGMEGAQNWLTKPNIWLGWRRPIDLMDSSAGAEMVTDHLKIWLS